MELRKLLYMSKDAMSKDKTQLASPVNQYFWVNLIIGKKATWINHKTPHWMTGLTNQLRISSILKIN